MQELARLLRLRVDRAVELGAALGGAIQTWAGRSPVQLQVEIAADRLSWSGVLHVREPDFDVWGRLFGDAVQNLRSALDNLVWGLAHLGGAVPARPKRLQFPVVEDKNDWDAESARIAELPRAARRAIESVQPFQRSGGADGDPSSDGLLLLHSLSVTDKHRIGLRPVLDPSQLLHAFSVDFGTPELAEQNVPPEVTLSLDVFTNGTSILHQVTRTPIVKVLGEFGVTAQVVLLDDRSLGVTSLLAELARYVPTVMDLILHAVAQGGLSRD
jgi:hypothetical protein